MYQIYDDTPRLKSLEHRKWLILIFWLHIIAGIISIGITFIMFFRDAEVFLVMALFTSYFFYRAHLYKKAFDGYEDWECFINSKIDIDELFEIAEIKDEEEKKRREKQVELRRDEYNRIWQVSWNLKLLKRKEKLYIQKTEKKKAKFEKKIKKLEEEMVPRCEGIKL